MSRNEKKAFVKIGIVVVMTATFLNILATIKPIITNKMALLQLQTDNLSYTIYKLYMDNSNLFQVIILGASAYLIYKTIYKLIKSEETGGKNNE